MIEGISQMTFRCSVPESAWREGGLVLEREYRLGDLIDLEKARELFDLLYAATGIPSGLIDADGSILAGSGWQDICTCFHRVHPVTRSFCVESDAAVRSIIGTGQKYLAHRCRNGLWDMGAPILIEGRHLGTIFVGQFFYESPDESFFEKQAEKYGFDREKYMAALRRVPIYSHERAEKIIAYYVALANLLARKGHQNLQMKRALDQTFDTLSAVVEVRDPYTSGHQKRVSALAVAISQEMKLDEEIIQSVRFSALVHDIGKINVPSEILSKPGALSDIEYRLIKEHPRSGYAILKNIDFPWPVPEIVLQHHERLDGSGYPGGLRNGDIRLEARIIAVADVVETMSSHRPYRPGLGLERALEEIEENRGFHYDDDVVEACLMLFRKGFSLDDVSYP